MLKELGFQKQAQRKKSYDDLIAGAGAGVVSSLITHPIDTLAVNKQTKKKIKWKKYKTLGAKTKRLYRGVGLRTAKIAPSMAISFASYKAFTKALDKKHTKTNL
jgi:hypothetical protein